MSGGNKPNSPFWQHLGIEEVYSQDGRSELRLEVGPQLRQRRGFAHGGVLATLVDTSIGSAVRSLLGEGQGTTTVELKVNFLKPASGNVLTAKASLYRKGETLAVGKSEIMNENGDIVAVGLATFYILKK